jgi:hypothetical protein
MTQRQAFKLAKKAFPESLPLLPSGFSIDDKGLLLVPTIGNGVLVLHNTTDLQRLRDGCNMALAWQAKRAEKKASKP